MESRKRRRYDESKNINNSQRRHKKLLNITMAMPAADARYDDTESLLTASDDEALDSDVENSSGQQSQVRLASIVEPTDSDGYTDLSSSGDPSSPSTETTQTFSQGTEDLPKVENVLVRPISIFTRRVSSAIVVRLDGVTAKELSEVSVTVQLRRGSNSQ